MKLDPKFRSAMRAAMQSEASGRLEVDGVEVEVIVHRDDSGVARRIRFLAANAPGERVVWFFPETRPEFWPNDLPFLPGTSGLAGETGAHWLRPAVDFEERIRDWKGKIEKIMEDPSLSGFQEAATGLVERWKARGPGPPHDELREDAEALRGRFGARILDLLGIDPSQEGTPLETSELARTAIEFYREHGWEIEEVDTGRLKREWSLEREGEHRRLSQLRTPMIPQDGLTVTLA